MKSFQYGLGLMSGTSLDGLDLALCRFEFKENEYQYEICETKEISYTEEFKARLENALDFNGSQLIELDHYFATYCAQQVNMFLKNTTLKPDFIASHGHTIFHNPQLGFTTQIGSGAILAAKTGFTVISDFRSLDVALGGQGAPLVPIGDQLLFHEYDACLNLGGIANISFQKEGRRIAYDISLCNIPLNYFAQKMGHSFDSDGKLAQQGNVIPELYKLLENLDFYTQQPPKSLGKEFFVTQVLPLVSQFACSPHDILRTLSEHFATQIAHNIPSDSKLLVTGGGAFNSFLMELIRSKSQAEIIIPDSKVVKFKEAIVFAFLGYLRLHNQNNTLSSVTGASQDSCGGAIYFMNS